MDSQLKENHVLIEHVENGNRKQIKVGYSWTMMLFGCLVPLLRKDWLAFFSILLVSAFLYKLIPDNSTSQIVVTLSYIVFGFYYNELFLKRALRGDWVPANATSRNRLFEAKYVKTHCYDAEAKDSH